MLNLRESTLFTANHTGDSAFAGLHYGWVKYATSGWSGFSGWSGWGQDGVNLARKIAVINVATIPADGETIVVGGKTYTFKNTALTSTQIKIGNLVTNGDFASLTQAWLNMGNWTITAGKATHTPIPGTGTPVVAEYIQPLKQIWVPQVIVGYTYVTGFTVTNRSKGQVQIKIGGVLGTARTTNATFSQSIVALTSEDLQFVPDKDFDGEISAVTVTESHADIKGMTAQAIADRINLDTVLALCTAYTGLNATGVSTYVVLISNNVGAVAAPTFTADLTKVVALIAFTLTLTEAQLENVLYWKKDPTVETDCIPVVLVERNSGTWHNFLY